MSRSRLCLACLLPLSFIAACMNEAPLTEALDAAAPVDLNADCTAPFDTVVSPSSGAIIEIGLDPSDIFYITHDALYRAPREGGEARKLFTRNPRSASTLAALWVRADDVVVYQDAWNVFRVPKAGGRATQLPMLERMRDGHFAARDGQLLSGWNTVVDKRGDLEREWWLLDVETMRVSELGSVAAPAGDDAGALGEGRLFWTDDPQQLVADTRLHSMLAAGGGETELPVLPPAERKLRLFGASGGVLYLSSDGQPARLPTLGGELETLADVEVADEASVLSFAQSPAGVLLGVHELRPGQPQRRYWLPKGAGEASPLPCIDAAEDPAFALDGDRLFSALRDAGIAARTLP